MDKISVIVPIYNVEKYLRRCVDSILNQTYKNLEVILVDDGSPDACPAICDEYAKKDSRIKVIHKQNGGLPDARNAGMAVATGDYYAFVDSDDYIDTSMYEKLLNKIKEGDSDVCLCRFFEEEETTGERKLVYEKNLTTFDNKTIFYYLLQVGKTNNNGRIETENIMGCVWRCLYSKKTIIPFHAELKFGEDLIFSVEFYKQNPKICIVDEPLYFYLQRQTSLVHNFSEEKFKRRIFMSEMLIRIIEGYVSDDELCGHKFHIYASFVNELLKNGQKKDLKKWLNNDFLQSLYSKKAYKLAKRRCPLFHYKVAYFFIYHKWYGLYSLILKLKK